MPKGRGACRPPLRILDINGQKGRVINGARSRKNIFWQFFSENSEVDFRGRRGEREYLVDLFEFSNLMCYEPQ